MIRTSTRDRRFPPTGRTSPSCRTRRSFFCISRLHVPDLVEEERAPVGVLEQPLLVLDRAREGAAHIAEELALEEDSR
jgi:hypothetical protein